MKSTHSLQRLLPVLVLALFLLLAGLTVVRSAAAYQKILGRSDRLDRAMALTYIAEKARQNDAPGALRLGRIGDCQALVITQGEAVLYDTYIYCYEGSLRELMIKRELTPEADMGRCLLPMEGLELEPEGTLLKIRCPGPGGEMLERAVALRSLEVTP
jgi:hypothetical protein